MLCVCIHSINIMHICVIYIICTHTFIYRYMCIERIRVINIGEDHCDHLVQPSAHHHHAHCMGECMSVCLYMGKHEGLCICTHTILAHIGIHI